MNQHRGSAGASRLGERKEAILRAVALVIVAVVLGAFVLSWSLIRKGRVAMERSDAAFHRGDLQRSIAEARSAALSYVPGAVHVREAQQRLEAIARGAEAEGDLATARRAWDALRLVEQQTDYPGRGHSEPAQRARQALERLDGAQQTRPD